MFEPVWFGNYIVPRWEAIALLAGSAIMSLVVIIFIVGTVIEVFAAIRRW